MNAVPNLTPRETIPAPLNQFITRRLSGVGDGDTGNFEYYHSNSWTVVSREFVFRIGDTIRVNTGLESKFWEIGRQCGAETPRLVETGLYKENPYVIYTRVRGDFPSSGDFTAGAARILARLHRQDASNFPDRGNWPDRRNYRYTAALEMARETGHKDIIQLTRMALWDFENNRRIPNHGDFRASNILLGEDDTIGVIDWTDAHLGTREQDIGGCDPEYIPALVRAYQIANPVDLDYDLIVGHSFARILSLIKFNVLPFRTFVSACRLLHQLVPGTGIDTVKEKTRNENVLRQI